MANDDSTLGELPRLMNRLVRVVKELSGKFDKIGSTIVSREFFELA